MTRLFYIVLLFAFATNVAAQVNLVYENRDIHDSLFLYSPATIKSNKIKSISIKSISTPANTAFDTTIVNKKTINLSFFAFYNADGLAQTTYDFLFNSSNDTTYVWKAKFDYINCNDVFELQKGELYDIHKKATKFTIKANCTDSLNRKDLDFLVSQGLTREFSLNNPNCTTTVYQNKKGLIEVVITECEKNRNTKIYDYEYYE